MTKVITGHKTAWNHHFMKHLSMTASYLSMQLQQLYEWDEVFTNMF